jgi:hypothetical protein
MGVSYLLWFFLGGLGAHRAFLIPGWVRKHNNGLATSLGA